ncbi:MAG: TetR/AcrR family transcriptional regulator [Candidatus Protistobacter heckmanni]|nr:TetR/AcrR family transcriptional regulator [Candidatus Protistobacter heckmanni]
MLQKNGNSGKAAEKVGEKSEPTKTEKVIAAAHRVFFRHGFKRVTMGDIAAEAGMSRPALYLVFRNKEDIYRAVMVSFTEQNLAAIRAGVGQYASVEEQLRFAFELWSVQPFKAIMESPEARDLIECGQGFAKPTMDAAYAAFEKEVAAILRPLTEGKAKSAKSAGLKAEEVAHVLAQAIPGFKAGAKDETELRALFQGVISLTLAAYR